MAWNEPGNGKNKDPWNSGDQPPDLDEVFKNMSNRLRGLFGGSSQPPRGPVRRSGGASGFALIIIGVLLIWGAVNSVHIIDEPERGVVLRFGKYVRTLQPGLGFTFPQPIEQVLKVDVRQVRSASVDGEMLTRDENIVHVDMAIQYRVKDAQEYLFQVRDPDQTLIDTAESSMRQVIGDNSMDFVLLEGRAQISIEIREILQSILDRYNTGLELTTVNFQDVRPPTEVKEAFDDAIKAREDKERLQNEAEAYSNKIIPEARGGAARMLEEARGHKESVIATAQGEAERFSLLLTEYEKAPEVTRQRLYLDTIEEVMGNSGKVLMEADDGNNMMYLPLDQLGSGSGASSSSANRPPPPYTTARTSSESDELEGRNNQRPTNREGRNR